jgi:poly-gamma-glutamate synthesis protein (capsule biosynthesis protein)
VAILTPSAEHSIHLSLAGDIMLGRGVAQAHSQGNWEEALAAIAPSISRADLAFANLESPITEADLIKETYDLRAPSQSVVALSSAGIDVLSLSNNHVADAGQVGIDDTLQVLSSAGILFVGPGKEPLLLQSEGVHIAWFALNDMNQDLDLTSIGADIADRRDHVDYVVLSIHWGKETHSRPDHRQRVVAKILADAGVDLIVGHHPHVLQPIEWFWGEGRGRPTLVAYSLGNALFDQGAPPAARQGALLHIDLNPLGIKKICVEPFSISPQKWNVVPANSEVTTDVTMKLGVRSCASD